MVFSFEVPATTRGIGVSLCTGAGEKTIFRLSTVTVFKVQRGGAHLFLDNDTNRSVDQYTGRLLLDEANQEAWRKYARLALGMDGPESAFRLLICPAKEEVFQDLYQHRRAQITPIDQVVDICAGPQLLFPLEALRRDRESSYSTVDTHWSDYGAKIGAIEYLRSVGLSRVVGCLPDDFYQRKVYGDLGGKVDGGQTGVFMTLAKGYRFGTPGFDNGIGNHGRIWTYTNDDAEVQGTLVIFGDSFSVSLSAILASVFRRVVYCYTAAGLDPEILEVERPGYVLAQTNQRFVVNSPGVAVSVFRQVMQKVSVLDDKERLSMRGRFGEDCPEPYYAKRMSGLLR